MAFWKKVGESIKKAGEQVADEIKTRQEISQTKSKILNRFEMKHLKKICRDYGIGEPSPYETNLLDGKKRKITLTRDNYINRIKRKLNLDQIKSFCNNNRIKIYDLIKDKPTKVVKEEKIVSESPKKVTTIEVKTQTEFESILERIEEEFEPEEIINERDFEKQLTQFLKYRYPGKVKRQVTSTSGIPDIVIDGQYAFELKIAENKNILRNLIGQAIIYKKNYNQLAVVLLDGGKMTRSDIQEYIEEYENHDIKTLIVDGVLRKKKSRKRELSFKY